MLALMSKTRWSFFSALPHLFFSVPTPFQSFIFHLHLLGNLIYSTLPQVPSVMKVCEQKHRTESRCLGVVQDKMGTIEGGFATEADVFCNCCLSFVFIPEYMLSLWKGCNL